jgi:hypothetical protein
MKSAAKVSAAGRNDLQTIEALDKPEWRTVNDKFLARRIGLVRNSLLTGHLNRRDSELPRVRAWTQLSVSFGFFADLAANQATFATFQSRRVW